MSGQHLGTPAEEDSVRQSLDVVVPIYNEFEILPELHSRLSDVLENEPLDWRTLYVDDGSSDGSANIIRDIAQRDSRVGGVLLSRNFGQQMAIAAGLSVSSADAVVVMDGDLQDPPEVIPRLLKKWRDGYDVVYAIKKDRKESWPKRMLFGLFYWILEKLSPLDIPRHAGNFSIMDRSVVEVLQQMPERHRFISGLRAYVGGRQTGIEFERAKRFSGDPRQSPAKLVGMALDAFFSFSKLPLRLATGLGFVVSGVAFVVLLNVLYQKLVTGEAILGWASIMTSILFLGGVQLLALGIVGEYIGRIYSEAKERPAFVIGEYCNLHCEDVPWSASLDRDDVRAF